MKTTLKPRESNDLAQALSQFNANCQEGVEGVLRSLGAALLIVAAIASLIFGVPEFLGW